MSGPRFHGRLSGVRRIGKFQRQKLAVRAGKPRAAIGRLGWSVVPRYFEVNSANPLAQAVVPRFRQRRRAEPAAAKRRLDEQVVDEGVAAAVLHAESQSDDEVANALAAGLVVGFAGLDQPNLPEVAIAGKRAEGLGGALAVHRVAGFGVELDHQIDEPRDVLGRCLPHVAQSNAPPGGKEKNSRARPFVVVIESRLAATNPLHYHARMRARMIQSPVGMIPSIHRVVVSGLILLLMACGAPPAEQQPAAEEGASSSAYRIYVTNEASGDLTIIDSATLESVAVVPLGKRPRGIHASPDGKTIYVALSGSPPAPPGVDESTLPPPDRSADGIGVVDVASRKLVKVIQSGTDPEEFALSLDGSLLYVANEDAGAVSIVDIAKSEVIKTLTVGGEPEGMTLSPDGSFVYVTSEEEGEVFVIDTAKGEILKNFAVGPRPRWVAFLPDGSKGYASLETAGQVAILDTVKHELIKTLPLEKGNRPMKVVVSRDGARAYVSAGRGGNVAVIDTASDVVSSLIPVDGVRPWGLDLSPDGSALFTANGPSNDVSVIDLATQKVVKKIPAGDSPWGVLVLDGSGN